MQQDNERKLRRRLWLAVGLTIIIFLAELIGGLWTSSLALLSDAFHVLTDAFSLVLTLTAVYLAMRPPSDRHTFGLHRLEIFAAAFNAGSLLVICLWLGWEAIERLIQPRPVLAMEMLIIATVGLIANSIVILLLYSHMQQSLNVKSAVLHVIGDTASSVGVIAAGITMALTGWFWIDPTLSLIIIAIIGYNAFKVAKEALHILMEGVPSGIETRSVHEALLSLPSVKQVHDLHIWSLCSNCRYLSAHLVVDEDGLKDPSLVLNSAQELLRNQFQINHATLQLETSQCSDQYLCDNHHHQGVHETQKQAFYH
ncbi:MAG: cation diffusion facilitator family transporter [Armatimonadetes bacterium]|nr:cation diffusion facilitator family transporter [Armatimonadota bacterium]